MKIIDKFLTKINKIKDKRKEKLLIKIDDDNFVVEALPPNEDNSNIDIKEVVKSMEDPEIKVEVVKNNLEEIIEQDNVRDTFQHLNDNDILRILEEKKSKIEENNKLAFAIQAIKNNEKKLKAVSKNIANLTDLELASIFVRMKSEKNVEKQSKMENEKIKLVSLKILQHIIKDGGVWHLGELTNCFSTDSKIKVIDLCVSSIASYEENKNELIDTNTKTKFILNFYRNVDIDYDRKLDKIDDYSKKGVLTDDEVQNIKHQMEVEKIEKEEPKGIFK